MLETWLDDLAGLRAKDARIVAGLMSGTSVDGVDVAICRVSGGGLPAEGRPGAGIELLFWYEHPCPKELRDRVRTIGDERIGGMAELHARIGDLFGEACVAAMRLSAGQGVPPVDLVGSHGQTVYHHSGQEGAFRCTLQLGDGDRIAVQTGLPVVSDFRMKDVAVGGEGAPLTPYADVMLFRDAIARGAVMLNLGGIANVSVLHEDPAKIIGFDTGPANGPIDRVARRLSSGAQEFDQDGQLAARGTVNVRLLERLLEEDSYLQRPPPKSTGFEMYGDEFVSRALQRHGALDANLLATLVEFTAQSIGRALRNFIDVPIREVIVVGGGARNRFLVERIQVAVGSARVVSSDEYGVPIKAREAMAWALFANEFLLGVPANLPSVTGASRPTVLGKLSVA